MKWMTFIKLLYIAAFFFLFTVAYGSEREFEIAVNAGNEVTPAMLASMYEALRRFILFVLFVFIIRLPK